MNTEKKNSCIIFFLFLIVKKIEKQYTVFNVLKNPPQHHFYENLFIYIFIYWGDQNQTHFFFVETLDRIVKKNR